MNTRFSALLIASLAGLVLSGPVLASPRFMDSGLPDFSAREDRSGARDFGKLEEDEMRKGDRQQEKDERRVENPERERGYGYGYERRNPQPRHDGRGRR